MFAVFVFISKLTDLTGIKIVGLDYLLWMAMAGVLLTLNLGLARHPFLLNRTHILLFLILLIFCICNFFTVKVGLVRYLQGTFFSFLFAATFIVFYNIRIEKKDLYKIIDSVILVITFAGVAAYLERIFIDGQYESFFLRGVKTLAKDAAFLSTLLNISVILCFTMYVIKRKAVYLYLGMFSIATVALMLFLKALIASGIICLVFIALFFYSSIVRYILYASIFTGVIALLAFGGPLTDEIEKRYNLYFGPGSEKIPRNALYIAGFKIARDHFPFGSGQGTFGSYPVGKEYSSVYYRYGLNNVHGLSRREALGFGKENTRFVFDTYWSSILGEMGFIATFFFVWLWFFPALRVYRYIKSSNKEVKALAFFTIMILVSIFIESIALALPGQVQFIILYAGLGAIVLRMILKEASTLPAAVTST